jgi:quercetin dioxygenase-like cupin family protein
MERVLQSQRPSGGRPANAKYEPENQSEAVSREKGSVDEFAKASLWKEKPEAWHEVMKGVRRRILSHSPTGMMVLYRIEPGSVFPLHSHPHAQFGYFLEGGGSFKVGDSAWRMGPGDSYYVPPGTKHELRTGSKKSVVIDFFTPERSDYHGETVPEDR